MSELAQRFPVDCLQLAESDAAHVVAELGRVPGNCFVDANAYARHQPVISGLLSRIETYDH